MIMSFFLDHSSVDAGAVLVSGELNMTCNVLWSECV